MTAFRSGIRTQDLNKSMLQSFKLNVLYWYIDNEYIPGIFFIPNTAYPHRTVMKLHDRTVNLLHNYLSIHITACKMTVLLIDSMHYNDVTMGAIASQITSLTIVHSNVIQTQIKENIKAPHHWPLFAGKTPGTGEFTGEFPHKWPVTRNFFSIWWRHHRLYQYIYNFMLATTVFVPPPCTLYSRWYKTYRESWTNIPNLYMNREFTILCVYICQRLCQN